MKLCNLLKDYLKKEKMKKAVFYKGIKLNIKDKTEIKDILETDSLIIVL